jgi:hypothetical protein
MTHVLRAALFTVVATLAGCRADIVSTAVTGSVSSVALSGPGTALYQVDHDALGTERVSVVITGAAATCANLTNLTLLGRSGISDGHGGRLPSLFLQTTRSELGTDSRSVGDRLVARFDPGRAACDGGGQGCGEPPEQIATGGSADLVETDDPGPSSFAKGSFDLTFPAARSRARMWRRRAPTCRRVAARSTAPAWGRCWRWRPAGAVAARSPQPRTEELDRGERLEREVRVEAELDARVQPQGRRPAVEREAARRERGLDPGERHVAVEEPVRQVEAVAAEGLADGCMKIR